MYGVMISAAGIKKAKENKQSQSICQIGLPISLCFFRPLNLETNTSDIAAKVTIQQINAHVRVPDVTDADNASVEYQERKIRSTNNIADMDRKLIIIGNDIFHSSFTDPVSNTLDIFYSL